jgi:ribosomal protein S18 acetylase RimI-like enzyme
MKYKKCKSCGGPVKDYPGKKVVNPDFCPYCVDEQGKLLGYKEIVETMIEYIKEDHKEIPAKKRLDTAQKWLGENPAWKKKFVEKDVLIEDVRPQNIKDIPTMNKKKKYICGQCMYYQKQPHKLEIKEKWFSEMSKKYGSCAKILYYKGKPVGYAQFAPKKEFPRLKDFKKGETDTWYISCIAIKKSYQGKGFGKILLNSVLDDLKRRGIKKVQVYGRLSGDASHFSSGYWSMYKKVGFKEISGGSRFKVGEKKLNR